jgi:hypothetical protein
MMSVEDMVALLEMEFMRKMVSLPWRWIPTNEYTDLADLKDIYEG